MNGHIKGTDVAVRCLSSLCLFLLRSSLAKQIETDFRLIVSSFHRFPRSFIINAESHKSPRRVCTSKEDEEEEEEEGKGIISSVSEKSHTAV